MTNKDVRAPQWASVVCDSDGVLTARRLGRVGSARDARGATAGGVPGYIKEGKSRPGVFSVTFALYSQLEGGDPGWAETRAVKVGAEGGYRVLSGSATNGGMPAAAIIPPSNSASSNLGEGCGLGIQAGQKEVHGSKQVDDPRPGQPVCAAK
jgi:hypothetical protein